MRHVALLIILSITGVATPVLAHEVRPGYLQLREVGQDRFEVLWKVPARGDYRLGLYVRLPDTCSGAPAHGSFTGGAFIERWRVQCAGGLVGKSIEIEGLGATRTDVLARVERLDGTTQTVRLTPEIRSFEVAASASGIEVAQAYFTLGVEHILLGIDHLLFVLALLFLVGSWRLLVATVTAFTLAHSITLAAASFGLVQVAQAPVEAAIALSVVFLAAEILRTAQGRSGLTARAPWVVAFAFGLLHGLGFAGALREIGLPQQDVPLALLFFNLGVEAGQLLFIAAVVAALAGVSRVVGGRTATDRGPWHGEALIRTPVAYVVGSVAAFWVVERVVAFWP